MNKYIVIHSYYNDDGGGGTELEYYNTLKDARKGATKGDIITKLVEEYKD